MVEFYRELDIKESTILKTDKTIRISDDILQTFLDSTNRWYTARCLELGADESEIKLYEYPSTDGRDDKMLQLCEYKFLMDLFFSLIEEDKEKILWKYEKMERKFNEAVPTLSLERVIGISPATYITSSSFTTIKRYRG